MCMCLRPASIRFFLYAGESHCNVIRAVVVVVSNEPLFKEHVHSHIAAETRISD